MEESSGNIANSKEDDEFLLWMMQISRLNLIERSISDVRELPKPV